MDLRELAGTDLGTHTATYDDRDAILYALAVGAGPDDLDLVYERRLRVLPTFALTLGVWAVEAAGRLGAYDPVSSLHVGQRLDVREPLPAAADVAMSAQVADVWDKGRASLVEVTVTSALFTARYTIFLPGQGGWGGERGPSQRGGDPTAPPDWRWEVATRREQALLYRLTGDRHPVHVDPAVAQRAGFDRPILHGLCTLGIAAREVASRAGWAPWDLAALEARFAAPVLPGDVLDLTAWKTDAGAAFAAAVGGTAVLADGALAFAAPAAGG